MAHTIVINIINRIKNTIVLVRKISSLNKKKPSTFRRNIIQNGKNLAENQRIGKNKKRIS